MRWKPPSERVQMILLSPILIPVTLAALPIIAVMAGPAWLIDRYSAWRRTQYRANPIRRWFAWRPVKFDGFWDGVPSQWLWLETVEARWRGDWKYRPLGFVSDFDEARP